MAITVRVFVQIILVILIRRIKTPQWFFLYRYWLGVLGLLLSIYGFNNRQIICVRVIDTSTVAGAFIMALLIGTKWINGREEHSDQKGQTDFRRIILYSYRFGIACRIGINLFVCRCFCVTVRKTRFCFYNACNLLEEMFCAPEASAC